MRETHQSSGGDEVDQFETQVNQFETQFETQFKTHRGAQEIQQSSEGDGVDPLETHRGTQEIQQSSGGDAVEQFETHRET
jgi:hypothetical protein